MPRTWRTRSSSARCTRLSTRESAWTTPSAGTLASTPSIWTRWDRRTDRPPGNSRGPAAFQLSLPEDDRNPGRNRGRSTTDEKGPQARSQVVPPLLQIVDPVGDGLLMDSLHVPLHLGEVFVDPLEPPVHRAAQLGDPALQAGLSLRRWHCWRPPSRLLGD